MFENIFVEKNLKSSSRVAQILKKLGKKSPIQIDRVDEHFGKFYKPYLYKRTNLNLYLGEKKGQLVKTAPPAYGVSGDPHYYFIHAFNCIYECQYCYLQGYFSSPDIVLFLNYEDMAREIHSVIQKHDSQKTIWFHAGEFSDSLALSHLTEELEFFHYLFKTLSNAKLEFRTKSANIKKIRSLTPHKNAIFSFSLAPEDECRNVDLKTSPFKARIWAVKELLQLGHKVALHFDPILYDHNIKKKYLVLIEKLKEQRIDINDLEYISLGVVRFSKNSFNEVQKNYPDAVFTKQEFIIGEDGKMRIPKPIRLNILNAVKNLLLQAGLREDKAYLCME